MTDSNDQANRPEDQDPPEEEHSVEDPPIEFVPSSQQAGAEIPPPPPPQPPFEMQPGLPVDGAELTADEKNFAMLAHVLSLVGCILFANLGGIAAALIIYFMKKDESKFVSFHALQALYFQIGLIVASLITVLLCMICIGFALIPVLIIAMFLFPIMAAMAANRGEWYSYPGTGSFVNRD